MPRADCQPAFADHQTYRGAGCTRTVRSSSSDAASSLQPDSNPQSPSADDSTAQPRRTSDPICGGAGAASGHDGKGHPDHVEIVISFDPHDHAASLSSVNSAGSGGSTAKLPPPGCALTPPPILSPSFWSSASSLGHFPTSKFASSAAAVSKSAALSQSVSSCSLNPPSALFNPSSLLSNTAYIRQMSASMSDRRQFSPPTTSSSSYVCVRRPAVDDGRQSSVDSNDDDAGAGDGSVFRADRVSESTPLLTQQVRGRRVDVPASLICCTPPRRRHVPPRPHRSPSPLAVPPRAANSPTEPGVAEFCAPEVARPARTRHQSLRRRSRRAALISAMRDKWHSIDLPDT